MNKTLRELLYYIKSNKRYGIYNENTEKYKDECQKAAYDVLTKTTEFFCGDNKFVGENDIYYCIRPTQFRQGTLAEFKKLQDMFRNTAVGVFGLLYDNTPHICCLVSNNPYRVSAYALTNNRIELCFYTFDGQVPLYSCSGNENEYLPKELINEIENLPKKEQEHNDSEKQLSGRFKYIQAALSNYVVSRRTQQSYAHYTFEIVLAKNCPMHLRTIADSDPSSTFTGEELCEFVDGSRYNWGCTFTGSSEQEDGIHYYGKINTD